MGHVHFAIDYLSNPDAYDLGDSVAVIGVGNSAIDAARTAIRKGSRHVTIYGRKPTAAASSREIDYAKIDGVEFRFCLMPVELTEEGPVMRTLEYDEAGKAREIPGSDTLHPAQSIIIAISQGPRDYIVNTTTGIETSQRGLVVTDECGSTSRPGVFASGDVVKGARTVVEAVKYSRQVADAMDRYMQGQDTSLTIKDTPAR